MSKIRFLTAAAILLLTACTPAPLQQVSKRLNDTTPLPSANFAAATTQYAPAAQVGRSNATFASDFLQLAFRLESGRALPRLTRFEGEITVKLSGDVPGSAARDLAALMGRLRSEAGINIRQVPSDQAASINVEFRSKRELSRAVSNAACFVVPEVADFDDYRTNHANGHTSWASLAGRSQVSVFAPSDASAQEIRDCLHEELAQALGPLNDMYHLTDSVFNDDNFNSILTRFDMQVLKAYYSPELHNGMNEAEVAAVLPSLLGRINPGGGSANGAEYRAATTPGWMNAVEASFGHRGSIAARRTAGQQMLSIAMAQGWTDGRLAFSHYALGRSMLTSDPQGAVEHLMSAQRIYRAQPGGAIHSAHVEMQLAALALSAGQADQAIAFADRALPAAQSGQNAALVSSLMMIKAEALEKLGQTSQAQAVRLDSRTWASYGFGSEQTIQARAREIARLASNG